MDRTELGNILNKLGFGRFRVLALYTSVEPGPCSSHVEQVFQTPVAADHWNSTGALPRDFLVTWGECDLGLHPQVNVHHIRLLRGGRSQSYVSWANAKQSAGGKIGGGQGTVGRRLQEWVDAPPLARRFDTNS